MAKKTGGKARPRKQASVRKPKSKDNDLYFGGQKVSSGDHLTEGWKGSQADGSSKSVGFGGSHTNRTRGERTAGHRSEGSAGTRGERSQGSTGMNGGFSQGFRTAGEPNRSMGNRS